MGRSRAEHAFGITTKHAQAGIPTDETALRDNLRGLVADHRVMLDSGVDVEVMKKPGAWAACFHRTKQAPPVHGVLPTCDRWGDHYAHSSFVSNKIRRNDVLGHESRHSLPCATRIAREGRGVGPCGNMRAEFESWWSEPVSYTDLCQGSLDLDVMPKDDAADVIAVQQDGDRVWPPRALETPEWAATAAALVKDLCDRVESADVRIMKTNGAGVYMQAVRGVIDDLKKDGTNAARSEEDFLGFGVGLFARNPVGLHSVRKHAMHGAMAAHMRERTELAQNLERLGGLVAGLCLSDN